MKKFLSTIATCLAVVLLIGIFPTQKAEAASNGDLGYYYLAKGETTTFKTDAYKGKISIVSKGGNTVKVKGKNIKVTAKKGGYIVFKAGKKEYSFEIIVGGNFADKKVNYKEYTLHKDDIDGCHNYIAWIRKQVKGGKKLPDKRYLTWEEKTDNKEIKASNRGLYIGMKLTDVPDMYPSWCDMGGWTDDEDIHHDLYNCALYYDKTSNCVFYKCFYGTRKDDLDDEVIEGVEWGCYKNNQVIKL